MRNLFFCLLGFVVSMDPVSVKTTVMSRLEAIHLNESEQCLPKALEKVLFVISIASDLRGAPEERIGYIQRFEEFVYTLIFNHDNRYTTNDLLHVCRSLDSMYERLVTYDYSSFRYGLYSLETDVVEFVYSVLAGSQIEDEVLIVLSPENRDALGKILKVYTLMNDRGKLIMFLAKRFSFEELGRMGNLYEALLEKWNEHQVQNPDLLLVYSPIMALRGWYDQEINWALLNPIYTAIMNNLQLTDFEIDLQRFFRKNTNMKREYIDSFVVAYYKFRIMGANNVLVQINQALFRMMNLFKSLNRRHELSLEHLSLTMSRRANYQNPEEVLVALEALDTELNNLENLPQTQDTLSRNPVDNDDPIITEIDRVMGNDRTPMGVRVATALRGLVTPKNMRVAIIRTCIEVYKKVHTSQNLLSKLYTWTQALKFAIHEEANKNAWQVVVDSIGFVQLFGISFLDRLTSSQLQVSDEHLTELKRFTWLATPELPTAWSSIFTPDASKNPKRIALISKIVSEISVSELKELNDSLEQYVLAKRKWYSGEYLGSVSVFPLDLVLVYLRDNVENIRKIPQLIDNFIQRMNQIDNALEFGDACLNEDLGNLLEAFVPDIAIRLKEIETFMRRQYIPLREMRNSGLHPNAIPNDVCHTLFYWVEIVCALVTDLPEAIHGDIRASSGEFMVALERFPSQEDLGRIQSEIYTFGKTIVDSPYLRKI